MAATAVFLLNRPPNKTIGGDTSYYRMFGRHVDMSFLRTIGTRSHGDHQAHLALTLRHTRSLNHLQPQQHLRAHWLQRRFIEHRQPGEGKICIREHVLFSDPFQRPHLLRQQRGFAPNRVGQLQQSKQTSRDQVLGAARLDHE